MPSVSPAQHRWIGWLHSNPAARERSGMSQAKVDEWLHADKGSPWRHAGGGGITKLDAGGTPADPSLGGFAPSGPTANPLVSGMIQRYSSYPTEKLAELAAMLGPSAQGQIVQRLLLQRRTMPSQNPDPGSPQVQAQQQAQAQQQQYQQQAPAAQMSATTPVTTPSYRQGGSIPKRQSGGMSLSTDIPWWTRQEARQGDASSGGFLHGVTGGRSDQVETQAPGGSHVIPADVIAGLGEGNGLAGARVMQAILDTGPYGTPMPRGATRTSIPRPPPIPREAKGGEVPVFKPKPRLARGGTAPGHTPVDLSDGEFVISPNDVVKWGGGDPEAGHKVWDRFIVEQRKKQIEKLKSLKPPVGMKK